MNQNLNGKLASLFIAMGAASACKGGIDLGSTNEAGSGSDQGSSGSATSGSSGTGSSLDYDAYFDDRAVDSSAPLGVPDAAMDSGVPHSQSNTDSGGGGNGCGGVCNGMTLASAPVTQTSVLDGTYALCAGTPPTLTNEMGGFPQGTAGIEFDGSTAYLLVAAPGGGVSRGVGPQYVWTAGLDTPVSSQDPSHPLLNLGNSFQNDALAFAITFFPGADGCAGAVHFVTDTSGLEPSAFDLVGVGP